MQNNFTHTHQQSVLVKYKKRLSRLRNAIREGSFSRFSSAKKRQLFQCLARYERQLRHWGIASGVALLLPVLPLQAQTPLPVGAEFRVNTHTTNSQNLPATAMDSDGDFVVTWYSNGQDGYGYGIYAQRYDPAGLSQGPEFRVNTYTTGLQREPAVAMDSDGDFVIAWHSNVQDGNSLGIYAQRYDNAGLPLGVEFQVNTYTTNSQNNPAIAMNSNGNFVVTWSSDGQDGNSGGIFARRYDNTGLPAGAEFQVNTYTTGLQSVPAIVMDSDGDFVVTWFSSGQDGSDGGIYAQRYDNAGTPQGTEFRVNSYTTGFQGLPAIGMDSNGNFVIAWASDDGNSDGVFARLYDNAGTPQGTEFLVNTYTNSQQRNNAVAMDSDGDFVVTWRSSGQDGSVSGIYAQRYDNAGMSLGAEFLINNSTTDYQGNPSIAMDSDGDFVVTWGSFLQDGSAMGVYAQRFTSPVLPIELLFFTGHAEATDNIIEWATATEKNSDWQIVERSVNGLDDWTEIGRIAGAGNSTDPISYKINDENPLPLSYYRLVALDFDGSVEYSEVISISRTAAELSVQNVFPVPADKEINLVVNTPSSGIVDVTVHNTLGQLVYWQKNTLVKDRNEVKIDLQGMSAGSYTVTIADGFSRVVQQVVKR